MKKIILASGEQQRWSGDTPKQLILVNDEILLERTLKQFGYDTIVVSSDKRITKYAQSHMSVKSKKYTCNTLLSTMNNLGNDDYIRRKPQ